MTTAQRPVITSESDPLLSTTSTSSRSTARAAEMGESSPDLRNEQQTVGGFKYLRHSLYSNWLGAFAQIGLLVSILSLWKVIYDNPSGLFSYHPAFQSLAIIGFSEGVLLLQPPSAGQAKRKGLQLHQIFQYTALPLILAGSSFIIYNKATHGAKHLTTWHAKFGALTLALVLAQIVFGALVVYSPLQRLFGGEGKAKRLWKYHRMSGYITLTLLIVTPLIALDSDWVLGHTSSFERAVIGGGLGLTLLGAYGRVQKSKLGL